MPYSEEIAYNNPPYEPTEEEIEQEWNKRIKEYDLTEDED